MEEWCRVLRVAVRIALKNGAHEWNRTIDLLLTKEVLYRLSYVSGDPGFLEAVLRAGRSNGAGDGNRTRTISLEG